VLGKYVGFGKPRVSIFKPNVEETDGHNYS
jgi:hypothetical protein